MPGIRLFRSDSFRFVFCFPIRSPDPTVFARKIPPATEYCLIPVNFVSAGPATKSTLLPGPRTTKPHRAGSQVRTHMRAANRSRALSKVEWSAAFTESILAHVGLGGALTSHTASIPPPVVCGLWFYHVAASGSCDGRVSGICTVFRWRSYHLTIRFKRATGRLHATTGRRKP